MPRFNEFPGAGESREPLGHDTDQHAGPGQVQTNQAQDKEAEGERQVRRLARTRRRAPAAAAGPESQPGIIAGSGGQGPAEMPEAG